ncbi:diaminopimelate epimerase [Microlunatus panaciterrae]|uniref:Diaminopimelate epimerase n=1 Tax=Microlunatus panaciterrae TaxID=400768 RepID=A0ABS2RPK5_9ACTN|nr:diaminopimelate epimerase [Microlunatus panaciterrae]MBM7800598.1 diaminopimelate epimerase [Microlunatus panaciterrae]
MRRWTFSKGHGTQNDFVLLQDRESMLNPGEAEVRFICHRHSGIGADGLLRAVRAAHIPEWEGNPDLWFMDYRNADGSVAEMCGNGIRVFVRFLLEQDLATGPVVQVATRAGLREATVYPDTSIRVAMGPVTLGGEVTVTVGGVKHRARTVSVGNPHAVSFVDDLQALQLFTAPTWSPPEAFPNGVNLEFVRRVGERHVAMRVYERGVGETRSCGTGTVAAAAAAAAAAAEPLPVSYRVDVPGGTVEVELTEGQAFLTGPAVIIANGELILPEEL